ncbi:hypothetical protein FO519_002747 [Halicephalobus sp. NKZ332]|nr:hypothetical protein FO519_002747 [Halicephalobus sp. NKZ332]
MRGIVGVFLVAYLALVLAEDENINRAVRVSLRSFPYMPMVRMLRPPEGSIQPRFVYPLLPASPSEMEIADIIDSIDANPNRERRSAPIFKRYACRFKFCRIFDA